MPYLTKLKLSPITNLADARFAAAAGIEYMGFCFDPSSEDFIAPIKAKEIIEWTSGTLTVAEFGNQSIGEIIDISELLNMDIVALNNAILPDELPLIGKPIMKVITGSELNLSSIEKALKDYSRVADAFIFKGLFDYENNLEKLQGMFSDYKIIWDLGAEIVDFRELIETFHPFGINLSAGVELKTGMRDFNELYDILEAIEQ